MADDPRAQAQARNLARHLNGRHPDTVLFLARQAAGRPAAVAAELVAVDAAGVTLSVDADGRTEQIQVPFPPSEGQVRARLGALLRQARAGDPDGPLTSLEQQHL